MFWVEAEHGHVRNDNPYGEAAFKTLKYCPAFPPSLQREMLQHMLEIDVRDVLPAVSCPVLVLHAIGDLAISVEHGRYLAEHLADVTYLEYEGEHFPWYVGTDEQLDA